IRDFIKSLRNEVDILKKLHDFVVVNKINLAINDILNVKNKELSFTPQFIITFLEKYLKKIPYEKVLNPFGSFGSLILPISKQFNNKKIVSIIENIDYYNLAKYLDKENNIEFILGNESIVLDKIKEDFDLVIGQLDFNLKSTQRKFYKGNKAIHITDSLENIVLLKSLLKLKQDGIGIFIIASKFFSDRNKNRVISNLEKFDFYIETALEIPAGSFYPLSSISGFLVIIRKGTKIDDLFVGELNDNKKAQIKLLNNLVSRKKGKISQEGILVKFNNFISLSKIIQEINLSKLATRLGLKEVKLIDIINEINLANKNFPSGFEDNPNCIYLPIIRRYAIYTSIPSDDYIYNKNFIQLKLDPNKISSQHFKYILETEFGRKWIDNISESFSLRKIRKEKLLKSNFYIMKKERFAEIYSTINELGDLIEYLGELAFLLVIDPREEKEAKEILDYYRKLNTIEHWSDFLPFPIATILWNSLTTDKREEKVDRLIYFFEAFTQFNATIILSGLTNNEEYYKMESKNWFGGEGYHKDWYMNTNFGNWINLYAGLSSHLRKLLEDKESKEMCLNLFNGIDEEFLRMIANKEIINLLEVPRSIRNKLRHMGEKSQNFLINKLDELRNCLNELRKIIGNKYNHVKFVLPGKNEKKKGIIYHKVNYLIGVKTPFPTFEVQSSEVMDTEYIYMLPSNDTKPLFLLPFIYINSSPDLARSSCYFYNKLIDNKPIWNIYHQGEVIDEEISSEVLLNALKYLQPYD
ncbi:MAG: N-6 DNA methylase, partial [Promethearchaeota archaeon]